MAILLTPKTETRLRERAVRDGRDPDGLAESVLAAFLDGRIASVGPDIPYVDDDDFATIDTLVADGEADFAAGRFKTLDQLRDDKRQQFGLEL